MALRITDLRIDPASLGEKFLLADIRPVFEYVNGEKKDKVIGNRYDCVLPKHKMEKIGVKVENKPALIDIETQEIPIGAEIKFQGLEIGSYFRDGQIHITAKATDASFVDKGVMANATKLGKDDA